MDTRDPLLRQWRRIAVGISRGLDLDAPTRLAGWRNREVVAHLTMQPRLLVRFLATATHEEVPPAIDLVANLSGTRSLAEMVDQAARASAERGRLDFAAALAEAEPALAAADLGPMVTVTTVQGPIRLDDYLITRCVEAVVHGLDLVPQVDPDPGALAVVAGAMTAILRRRRPDLVAAAAALDPREWVEVAAGRQPAPDALAEAVPLIG